MKIGLTGSLSSGKSTAIKYLGKGILPIFSADDEVKKLYKKKNLINKINRKFNIKIKNKSQLRNLVLLKKIKIKSLEKIIHPLVRLNMRKFIIKNKKRKKLLFEIPLLIESKLTKNFDIIIFLSAKKSIRLKRFIKAGGNKKLFQILDKRQMSPNKKKSYCNYTVENNSSLKNLKKNINQILINNE